MLIKRILTLLLSGLAGTVLFIAPGYAATPTNEAVIPARVSKSIVAGAGFTVIKQHDPATGRYRAPVYYFETKETVSGAPGTAWGDAASLVAVLVQPIEDETWVFNKGDMQTTELTGRFQAAVSSPGYFIVVTGPDKNKVMTLTHTLKVLY